MIDKDTIQSLFHQHLSRWSLYDDKDLVRVHKTGSDDFSLMYFSHPGHLITTDQQHKLMINITDGIFYLLFIGIARRDRGYGHGARLYDIMTDLARELGCKWIEQYPSGATPAGESRMSYLLRHGWEQYKKSVRRRFDESGSNQECGVTV